MNKKLLLSVSVILSAMFCHAEKKIDFFTGFSPTFMINTKDVKKSAPSPIVYPVTFGVVYPKESRISFQPALSFFTNYFLYDKDIGAAPAEIENRTATVFSFLLDLPADYTLNLGQKHSFVFGGGPSFLVRFGTLSLGVSDSDAGSCGTAADDVSEINKWFWKDANFLYLHGNFCYLYRFSDSIRIGPSFRFYLPCGSIFTGNGLNLTMISIGVTARF